MTNLATHADSVAEGQARHGFNTPQAASTKGLALSDPDNYFFAALTIVFWRMECVAPHWRVIGHPSIVQK